VSTQGQDLEVQKQQLADAGATCIFDAIISGRAFDRPGLPAVLSKLVTVSTRPRTS
jgi:DNA invertase Pin-like site-specific DNA recombinase